MSQRFGSSLVDLGLKLGDKVAVVAPNCPEVDTCSHTTTNSSSSHLA